MKPFIVFVFLINFSLFLVAQEKLVCFTIDDLPIVPYRHVGVDFEARLTSKLLEKLNQNRIPAIGFVNEKKLYKNGQLDSARLKLLREWLDAGMDLGNHTFSHIDFNGTECGVYFNEILAGQKVTKELMDARGMPLRYFRHPYLHTGETKAKADSLELFLGKNGYESAPVTIDNTDYLFAFAYDSAMVNKDSLLMKKIGKSYVDYMESKVQYFERQSIKLFERNISHILLLHANALNSDYMGELAGMFKNNGYRFASLEEVLRDEAYQTEISVFKKWGISWLDRWALSAGHKGDFFTGEPETPPFILGLAKQ